MPAKLRPRALAKLPWQAMQVCGANRAPIGPFAACGYRLKRF
jgi:hypothetical protein